MILFLVHLLLVLFFLFFHSSNRGLLEKAIYSLDTEPDDLCRALRGDIGRTALALDKEESDEEREQRMGGF